MDGIGCLCFGLRVFWGVRLRALFAKFHGFGEERIFCGLRPAVGALKLPGSALPLRE